MSGNSLQSTMDKGIDLAASESSKSIINIAALQLKEVGLSVMLLGLAEMHAARIKRLTTVLASLEDDIFNEDLMAHMSPRDKIETYQLALQTISTCTGFIKGTVNSVDWSGVEIKMASILPKLKSSLENDEGLSSTSEKDLKDMAHSLLKELGTRLEK